MDKLFQRLFEQIKKINSQLGLNVVNVRFIVSMGRSEIVTGGGESIAIVFDAFFAVVHAK